MEVRQKYMTVPAAIRELEKIEMVRRNGGMYKLDQQCLQCYHGRTMQS